MIGRIAEPVIEITEGALYRYQPSYPAGCQDKLYRVLRLVTSVPDYQQKVLVECLEGPHAGLWFVCSEHNFSTRYKPAEQPPPPPAKVAGEGERGKGI